MLPLEAWPLSICNSWRLWKRWRFPLPASGQLNGANFWILTAVQNLLRRRKHVKRPRRRESIVADVGSFNHRNASTLLRRRGPGGDLSRLLLILLFLASFGSRSAEPCWGGHHDADGEAVGAHQEQHRDVPSSGHRHSGHESVDACCASASACETRGEASLTTAASTVRDSTQVPVWVLHLSLPSSVISDDVRISRARYHAPPATPLFITLKALLI